MDLGNLTDNKLMTLALRGYGPFQPEAGIFCGAYQGILYPQPTTLSYPGFDPYLNIEAIPTEFTPNKTYTGLGPGNPGIDYKNPGHILGLLDTFGRMSYGIGVLQAIADGEDGSMPIGPAVDLALPLVFNSDFSDASIGLSDIYPALSEVPSAYINHFSVDIDGIVSPDPRPAVDFHSLGFGISPILNTIDDKVMNNLFFQRSIFSYLGMPQYFRSIIDAMSTSAQSLATKSTHIFSLKNDQDFNNYSKIDFFNNRPTLPFSDLATFGHIVSKCEVMNPTQALQTLTNSSIYHNGIDGQNEFRSLTELNSVVNLVPLQMIGATYQHQKNVAFNSVPEGGFGGSITSYAIFDFVINVSDISPDPNNSSPGTVTLTGDITVQSMITNVDSLDWKFDVTTQPTPISNIFIPGWEPNVQDGSLRLLTMKPAELVKRHARIQISSRNNTSWDKEWLGGKSVDLNSGFSDTSNLDRPETVNNFPHNTVNPDGLPLDTSPLIVPFNQTVELDRGTTSIRLRAFARTSHSLGGASLLLDNWQDPNDANNPDGVLPTDPIFWHEHIILDGIEFVLDFHSHPFLGVLDNLFLGDALALFDQLTEEAITLSLTVNGTRLNTLSYEMSN